MLKLSEAIAKSKRQIIIGWTIGGFSIVLLIMGLTKLLYVLTRGNHEFLNGFYTSLNQATIYIYQKTQFLKLFWDYAPELQYPEIFVSSNLKFAAVLAAFVLGVTIRDSGVHLASKINDAKAKAQAQIWQRSLSGQTSLNNTLNLEIQMQSKDSWYTRPVGLVALMVIGGYIVNLFSKLTGLI